MKKGETESRQDKGFMKYRTDSFMFYLKISFSQKYTVYSTHSLKIAIRCPEPLEIKHGAYGNSYEPI